MPVLLGTILLTALAGCGDAADTAGTAPAPPPVDAAPPAPATPVPTPEPTTPEPTTPGPTTPPPGAPPGPDAPIISDPGDTDAPTDPAPKPPGRPDAVSASLTVTVADGPEAEPTEWTLRCDPVGGTHPDARHACAALAAAQRPFAPVPKDVACTEIYGGPEVATVSGTFRGERVLASFSRINGCEISRWENIAEMFGPVTGAVPGS